MASSLGKLASMILSKCVLLSPSPALNRYARQIANRHCKPARTEGGSFVCRSWMVKSMKVGHFSGKSQCRILCRMGMSCCRMRPWDEARMGSNRSRTLAFSSSGMGCSLGKWSVPAHARFTRFLM